MTKQQQIEDLEAKCDKLDKRNLYIYNKFRDVIMNIEGMLNSNRFIEKDSWGNITNKIFDVDTYDCSEILKEIAKLHSFSHRNEGMESERHRTIEILNRLMRVSLGDRTLETEMKENFKIYPNNKK